MFTFTEMLQCYHLSVKGFLPTGNQEEIAFTTAHSFTIYVKYQYVFIIGIYALK